MLTPELQIRIVDEGVGMSGVPKPESGGASGWTRVAMIIVRLALLVFLIWALFTARLPMNTPVAEDSPNPAHNSGNATELSADDPQYLG